MNNLLRSNGEHLIFFLRIYAAFGMAIVGLLVGVFLLYLVAQFSGGPVKGPLAFVIIIPISLGFAVFSWKYSNHDALIFVMASFWRLTKTSIAFWLGVFVGVWLFIMSSDFFPPGMIAFGLVFLVVMPLSLGVVVWRHDKDRIEQLYQRMISALQQGN